MEVKLKVAPVCRPNIPILAVLSHCETPVITLAGKTFS